MSFVVCKRKLVPHKSVTIAAGGRLCDCPDTIKCKCKQQFSTHVVVEGDSLTSIARDHYGNGDLWPVLFFANSEMVSDPNLIYPGWVLQVPEIPCSYPHCDCALSWGGEGKPPRTLCLRSNL